MPDGWNHDASPFHAGERLVQERLRVRDRTETVGRRIVRDHMPDQHREFYARLPLVLVGSVDDRGRPWASPLAGGPGFLTSPDPRTLDVAALPHVGDPLHGTVRVDAEVGVLGIELETRRRNRLNGRIATVRSDGFAIAVRQAFGNCPKYIQTRSVEPLPAEDAPGTEKPVHRSDRFDARIRALIAQSDTLFIATAYGESPDAASQGADVSHRGGKPGFVRAADDRSLVLPDFSGNNHFNTIGNLVMNPKAGLLFIDFETGDLVYTTGAAEIVWEGEEVAAFAGAERLIRFRVEEVIRIANGLPLRFRFKAYSPALARTGSWTRAFPGRVEHLET